MAGKQSVAIDTIPMPERPLRITLPAKVAFDLASLQKVLGNLAETIGCRACLSGVDCTFRLERDFIVNAKTLGIESLKGGITTEG